MTIINLYEKKKMLNTEYNIECLVRCAQILEEDYKKGAPHSILIRNVGTISAVVGTLLKDLTDRMVDEEPPMKKAVNDKPY